MENSEIPFLSIQEITEGIKLADSSSRRRYPKILHNSGDEFNRVVNFMMTDSYMQPHMHSGEGKIEKIYIIEGSVATFFFDDFGTIIQCNLLEKGRQEMISVPAFTWHTYVIISDYAITYETMMGKYDPHTWKDFFIKTPSENSTESVSFLKKLKLEVLKHLE